MRIHRLDIEAFGPFATPQHIDFDQLSSQGLFLLNGPTGAGKTSILDAICFALYGSVPGARQEGKRLRSDHAAPGAEPRVVCEFTARGRRFEVSRSPAWERPSARGRKGYTTQQAKTLLRERIGGTWEEKSSRNDEVGAELSDVETRSVRYAEEFKEAEEKSLRHARLAAALQRKIVAELAAPRALENREALAKHRRAAVLSGQLDAVGSAARKVDAAVERVAEARGKLAAAGVATEDPTVALDKAKASHAVLQARLPDEQRMEEIAGRLAAKRTEETTHLAAAAKATSLLAQLREEASTLESRIEPLEPLAAHLADRERDAASAAELVGIVARYSTAAHELDTLNGQHLQARSASQDLRQRWLDVRELRLANAAGELAAALENGKP
ncbi:AAA family ATPase, partial [Paenarthrobacter sp. RAF9]